MALICGLFQGTTHNMFLATHRAAWSAGALPANYVSRTTANSTLSAPYMTSNSIRMSAPTGSNSATERMVYATSPVFTPGTADTLYFDMWVYIPTSLFSSSNADTVDLISFGDTDYLTTYGTNSQFHISCNIRQTTNLYNMRTHTDTGSNEDAIIYFQLEKLDLSTGDYSARELLGLTTSDTQFAGWNRFVFYYSAYNNAFNNTALTSDPLFYNQFQNQRNTISALFNQGSGNSRVKEEYDDTNRYTLSIDSPDYAHFGTATGYNNSDYMLMGPTTLLIGSQAQTQFNYHLDNFYQQGSADYPYGIDQTAGTVQFYFNWAGATETARLTKTAGFWGTVLDDDTTGSLTTGTF